VKFRGVALAFILASNAARADVRTFDTESGSPMPAAKALKTLEMPEGFTAQLFASEPYVRQPIDMKVDARGRVWVAEAYSYMSHSSTDQDRIVVLTDKDGNGMADTRNIFLSGVENLMSVEVGFGGVWVLAPPNLTFYPDADGDLKPDSAPVIHLTNWNTSGQWNMVNGLSFGPDGWLYGRIGQGGASSPRSIRGGSPGRISGGVWRYHPVSSKLEIYAHGMTNPWGLDWNEDGELFVSGNCNGHLWHIVGGSLYEWGFGAREFSSEFGRTPAIEIAPHYSPGKDWWSSWQERYQMADANDAFGGGHSHSGLVICNGSAWPEKMRGHSLMSNIHGGRINEDTIEPNGSSYISRRVGDPIKPADPWFRGVSLVSAPDGALFISDWSDTGECHDRDAIHQSSGRIYRIQSTQIKPLPPIDGMDDKSLLDLLTADREEPARRALKNLQHRIRQKKIQPDSLPKIAELQSHPDFRLRLRALSALHGSGVLDDKQLLTAARDSDERVRAMAVRYWAERTPDTTLDFFREMAASDPSPRVMLHLASVTRLLPESLARSFVSCLISRDRNPIDARTAQLLWHIRIQNPVWSSSDAERLIPGCKSGVFASYLATYLVENGGSDGIDTIFSIAATSDNPSIILNAAIETARKQQGFMSPPAQWSILREKWMASPDQATRGMALSASILFGDTEALQALNKRISSPKATLEEKTEAIETFAAAQTTESITIVGQAFRDPVLRKQAIRALRHFKQTSVGLGLLENWQAYDEGERHAVIETLVTRREWALSLLDAIGSGKIPKSMLTAAQARGLAESGDAALQTAVLKHWGSPTRTSEQKEATLARATHLLSEKSTGDPAKGRLLFSQSCGACHLLYGEGGKLGPDLTGRNRADLASLIRSIVDPSADVPEDGRMTIVTRKDGSIASGIIVSENATAITVRSQQGDAVIRKDAIANVQTQDTSPMPEGLLDPLTDSQLQDLFAYLRADQAASPK
jgi:putative membrane-bound dehydrogenase-like protein